MLVVICRSLCRLQLIVERKNLSKDIGSDTGGGGEESRAGKGSSASSDGRRSSGRVAVARVGAASRSGTVTITVTLSGSALGRGRDSTSRGTSTGRAGALDGRVLNGGQNGGVALGDGNDAVADTDGSHGGSWALGNGGLAGSRTLGSRSGAGGTGTVGNLLRGPSGGTTLARRGGHGVVAPDLSRVGNLRSSRADGGRDGDGLSGVHGAAERAVANLSRASGDGVDLGAVDGAGGPGNSRGADRGRRVAERAVADLGSAGADGDQRGHGGSGHNVHGSGHGSGGQDNGGGDETHFE